MAFSFILMLSVLYLESLDRTSEMTKILETDTPAVRLLKARTYLTAAGALLKRVIFVVVGDVFRQ